VVHTCDLVIEKVLAKLVCYIKLKVCCVFCLFEFLSTLLP